MTSVGSLNRLPTEVHNLICKDLGTVELRSLCLTSWELYEGTLSHLYRHITFDWGNRYTTAFNESQPPAHLLLRSLLNKPALASHVESFTLFGKPSWAFQEDFRTTHGRYSLLAEMEWPGIIFDFSMYTEEETKEVSAEMTKHELLHGPAGFNMKPKFYTNQLSQNVLPLLILKLENLRELCMDSDFFKASVFDKPFQFLKHLQSVEICYGIDDSDDILWHRFTYKMDCIPQLFSMPKLQCFSAILPPVEAGWFGHMPAINLQSLTLHKCELIEESLGELLRLTPTLKSLEYHPWIDCNFKGREDRSLRHLLDCDRLTHSLKWVRRCLERLVITVLFYNEEWEWSEFRMGPKGICGRLTCLSQFAILSHIDVPSVMLLGWELPEIQDELSYLLPPSLQDLTISDDAQNIPTRLRSESAHTLAAHAFLESFSQQAKGGDVPHLSLRTTNKRFGQVEDGPEEVHRFFRKLLELGREYNVICNLITSEGMADIQALRSE